MRSGVQALPAPLVGELIATFAVALAQAGLATEDVTTAVRTLRTLLDRLRVAPRPRASQFPTNGHPGAAGGA